MLEEVCLVSSYYARGILFIDILLCSRSFVRQSLNTLDKFRLFGGALLSLHCTSSCSKSYYTEQMELRREPPTHVFQAILVMILRS